MKEPPSENARGGFTNGENGSDELIGPSLMAWGSPWCRKGGGREKFPLVNPPGTNRKEG